MPAPASDADDTLDTAGVPDTLRAVLARVARQNEFHRIAQAACQAIAIEWQAGQAAIAWRGRDGDLRLLSASPTRLRHLDPADRRAWLMAMEESCDQQVSLHSDSRGDPSNVVLGQRALAARLGGRDAIVLTTPLPRGTEAVGALSLCLRGPAAVRARAHPGAALDALEALAAPLAQILEMSEAAAAPWPTRLRRRLKGDVARPRRRRVVAAASLVLAVAAVVPFDRQLSSDAQIRGAVERQVAAPAAGTLADVLVEPGARVRAGDTLAVLTDEDLLLERDRLTSLLAEHRGQADAAMAGGDRAALALAQSRIEQTRAELDRHQARLDEARLRAPIDGVVLDGVLRDAAGTPVERGQTLFTLAPAERYRVIIDVDEAQRHEVRIGQHGRLGLNALDVAPFDFEITRIAPVTVRREARMVFEAEARLHSPPPDLRAGMGGVARVTIVPASLVSRWTERLRKTVREFWWRWAP